jgi:predicted DNA-binding transcriptional regulator YafY
MRASRLVSIILSLQNHGKMSARQLSEQLEVSERTILRDMEELSASGVPVYAERGKEGGWLLAEGYRTTLTGIHADELAALLVASRPEPLSDLGRGHQLEAALQKLLAAATESARSGAETVRRKLHIDGAGWQPDRQRSEPAACLAAVQEAVWQERALRIAYMRDGAEKVRRVHPLGLVAKRGVWYLVAGTEKEEPRTFRISRLLWAEALPEIFETPVGFDLAAYWESSLERFREQLPRYPAKLRVRADAMKRLETQRFVAVRSSHAAEAEAGWTGDGHVNTERVADWVFVEAEFETPDSACEIVLGFGGRIEVLEPPELRRLVKDEIRSASMVYL